MIDLRDRSEEIEFLDVLVFLASNVRVLFVIPLIVGGLAYIAIAVGEKEYRAYYDLRFPPSVHPYLLDPIFLAAFTSESAAEPSMVGDGIRWSAEARSEKEAVAAVTTARNAALDTVSDLVAANIASEAGGYLGLSEAGIAKQLSTVRRWAQFVSRQPVEVGSNAKGSIWIALASALSFISVLVVLVVRHVLKLAQATPEGAAKVASIKKNILFRKR